MTANGMYIHSRNALIPEAERLAKIETGKRMASTETTQAFFRHMDRLWREKAARMQKYVSA